MSETAETPKYDFEAMGHTHPEIQKKLRARFHAGTAQGYLMAAFVWSETPQGSDFWQAEVNADALSPEGRAAIEEILAQAERQTGSAS